MPGRKCPTVRSGGTTSMRSALIPILMTSRASMEVHRHSGTRAAARGPGIQRSLREIPGSTLGLPRNDARESFLRKTVHEQLAALHLVGERGFVDLDDDGFRIDAEILD